MYQILKAQKRMEERLVQIFHLESEIKVRNANENEILFSLMAHPSVLESDKNKIAVSPYNVVKDGEDRIDEEDIEGSVSYWKMFLR